MSHMWEIQAPVKKQTVPTPNDIDLYFHIGIFS